MKKSPGKGFPSRKTSDAAAIIRHQLQKGEECDLEVIKNVITTQEFGKKAEDIAKFINVHSLLHWSVYYSTRNLSVVEYLINLEGVNANESFGDMRVSSINFFDRPLHIASRNGNLECCKLLVEHGATIDILNRFLERPEDVSVDEEVKSFFQSLRMKRGEAIVQNLSLKLSNRRIIRFGVLTDLHHGDISSLETHRGEFRMYALGKTKADAALEVFRNMNVEFVLCLGDLVDIQAEQRSEEVLSEIGKKFQSSKLPFFFVCGNHDKYHLTTPSFLKCLNFSPFKMIQQELTQTITNVSMGKEEDCLYYFFDFKKCTRFIFLDAFDFSCLSHNPQKSIEAYNYLRTKNPKFDPNGPYLLLDDDEREGEEEECNKRHVYYTGGLGNVQLEWLKKVALEESSLEGISVIIISCHLGVLPGEPDLCSNGAVLWNYKEVYDVLRSGGRNGRKMYYLFGHYHRGGKKEVVDKEGITHYCFPGAIRSDVSSSFSVCEVSENGDLTIGRV